MGKCFIQACTVILSLCYPKMRPTDKGKKTQLIHGVEKSMKYERIGNLFMLNAVGKVRKVFQTRRKSNLGSLEG